MSDPGGYTATSNNATYYSYFDTAVNSILIERGLLDIIVHVHVDRATMRPVPLPAEVRKALAPLHA